MVSGPLRQSGSGPPYEACAREPCDVDSWRRFLSAVSGRANSAALAFGFDRLVHQLTELRIWSTESDRLCGLVGGGVVHVGTLAVAVDDKDELGRLVDRVDDVRGHRGELCCFASVDYKAAFADGELEAPREHEQPVVTGVDLRVRAFGNGFEAHLDCVGVAGGPAQRPGRDTLPARGGGPDDNVVVLVRIEEGAHIHLECSCEGQQDVEADLSSTGLDTTDRGGIEVAPFCEVVE